MALFRVYIRPFDDDGNYTSWVEISKYVSARALSALEQSIDSSDYQLGVFRYPNFNLTLDNRDGSFSDVGGAQTIFRYKRSGSQIKVTFCEREFPPLCGFMICGDPESAMLWTELTVFKGLLNDESCTQSIADDTITFNVLGFESEFSRAIVPFGTVHNGDLTSAVIFNCLNQDQITNLLTVDQANISVGIDQQIDSIASLQNKTVKEGLDKLLLATNSVLFIENDTIYISARTPTAEVKSTFYGQASALGPENIQNLFDVKNGLSRTFNFFSWKDAPAAMVTDPTSTTKYGIRKKELDLDFFEIAQKQVNILTALRNEFSTPKQELSVTMPATPITVGIRVLDRIAIDYPTVLIPAESEVPVCGAAEFDVAVMPDAAWSFSLDTDTHFKVISKKVNPGALTVDFRLREI
ncbi:MAG: hypothetical protein A2428_03140 [Bdellovibrionales bacterium RIFOXYC1_FULL_54_43]|nr:MAG: hypothetical protein A2428_03140 [Bdellovibrionales bacterium RIFOXYC1_FULL_54_43]OFZ82676.1 MAG: hypothetical protein A2603_02575 [Bdellovibrionales bacterium RIFOXYD1_FULL_55_31]